MKIPLNQAPITQHIARDAFVVEHILARELIGVLQIIQSNPENILRRFTPRVGLRC